MRPHLPDHEQRLSGRGLRLCARPHAVWQWLLQGAERDVLPRRLLSPPRRRLLPRPHQLLSRLSPDLLWTGLLFPERPLCQPRDR